ncbi:MAG: hypothetical protein OEN23_20710 [Paracoccaceae bacterium]|nr:hypothetical protein [Paracoccaceae bacterium]
MELEQQITIAADFFFEVTTEAQQETLGLICDKFLAFTQATEPGLSEADLRARGDEFASAVSAEIRRRQDLNRDLQPVGRA